MTEEGQPAKRWKISGGEDGEEGWQHTEASNSLPILTRENTDAETFRQAVWDGVFNRRRETNRVPRAVVRASCAAHVKETVQLAIAQQCRISVRSGGHSYAAWSVRDDAILLDLGGLKDLAYDAETKIVSCGAGLTGEQVNDFLRGHGRMFAGGHCPDVGLGGFLLQGGMGWNAKNWGWACESIVAVDVVAADGREIYCSTAEHPDLFWAARGAGPGFPGIVTRFYLLTRPLLHMYNCVYVYPKTSFRAVLQWVIDTCPTADPDTEIVCVSKRDGEDIKVIAAFLTFKGDRETAEAVMRPVHDSRPPGADMALFCGETGLPEEYGRQRREQPPGHRYCADDAYISNDVADVPAVLEEAFMTLPTQRSVALYLSMNPTSRRPLADMALSMQSDHYFAVYAVWDDEGENPQDENGKAGANREEEARCVDWVRDVMKGVGRHSVGSYLGDADFQQRTTRFWSPENGERLRLVRKIWDPEGRICGYLVDAADAAEHQELKNEFEWLLP
ncbi:FAD-binding domain-containing protein [Xylariaceae sp. FL0255]|nr:FAD-binding domain-containing protein [Xylariaceae sp. FL0255]